MEQTATVANGIDILAVFDNIQINNEEKISLPDKEFCERQQCLLRPLVVQPETLRDTW